MNQATNVNIVPSYGQRGDLHFSQYDVGRTATINLYAVNEAYTIPVGATVKIQATKPSGLGFDVACTYSGSVVTVTSTATMTAEAGRFPCEIKITKNSDIIGTANIMFCVEPSPHPDDIVDGDAEQVVNQIKALVLEAEGYSLGTQNGTPVTSESVYYENNAKWYSENAVLSAEVKQNLLQCFRNVAWIGNNGQTYCDALANALNRGNVLVSISAVYTQGGTVYDTDSLDSLKSDLVVTASYNDSSTETVLAYTLSGTLTVGTSTITVSYGGKTTTFTVNVTEQTDFTPDSPVITGGGNFADNVLGYNSASTKRGSFNPLALFNFKYGDTYTISMNGETSIHYALAVYKMPNNADTYDFEVVQGTDKTFSSNVTYISALDHSWSSNDTTFTWNYDSTHILLPTFRNSSNTTFTSTNVNTAKNKFSITKVTP